MKLPASYTKEQALEDVNGFLDLISKDDYDEIFKMAPLMEGISEMFDTPKGHIRHGQFEYGLDGETLEHSWTAARRNALRLQGILEWLLDSP
ncbi:hypothetical protein [Candidatus Poriferisocius sp.]|uniref:hypothetical protein n=1 Tax=Candidatus Poriferisocius sp. TaxID=3101276 RepID=UPI003B01171E